MMTRDNISSRNLRDACNRMQVPYTPTGKQMQQINDETDNNNN